MLIFTLIWLFVVAWIVLSSKASFSGKPGVIPEELDLNSVRDSLMEKQGWNLERAEAARGEYVRFLTLLQRKPGFMVVPWPNAEGQDDLDQFWHQHILNTAKYANDCNRLFGRMIHHNPHIVRGSGQERDAVEKTHRLYARTFNSGSDGGTIDVDFLTDCGASTTTDSHGHGVGGHESGGHSCGGHSCGGHGCGHGCGGH